MINCLSVGKSKFSPDLLLPYESIVMIRKTDLDDSMVEVTINLQGNHTLSITITHEHYEGFIQTYNEWLG